MLASHQFTRPSSPTGVLSDSLSAKGNDFYEQHCELNGTVQPSCSLAGSESLTSRERLSGKCVTDSRRLATKKASLVCALISILLSAAVGAKAQTATGQITGAIKDATGAVVPGAKVTVTSAQTGFTRDTVSTRATSRLSIAAAHWP